MEKILYAFLGILLLILTWIFLKQANTEKIISNPVQGSCTIFSASIGDKILFGNNEDNNNPNTCYWTECQVMMRTMGVYT
jgi:hypothetical protein